MTLVWSKFELFELVEAIGFDDECADTCVAEITLDDVESRTLL